MFVVLKPTGELVRAHFSEAELVEILESRRADIARFEERIRAQADESKLPKPQLSGKCRDGKSETRPWRG